MVSTEQYFTATPRVAATPTEVEFRAAGRTFRLGAAAGVFAAARLDPGTAVLLHKARLPAAGTEGALLDLGCGYGPIACVLATVAPAATVYAVDVNVRALELTRVNAARLGVGARVVPVQPDEVSDDLLFAEIWSNPPIRVGKRELHALLDRWLPRLAAGGTAWLVVGRHLGADSLAPWLSERGWHVHRHASQRGYRVLRLTGPVENRPVENGPVEKSRDGEAAAPENL